MIDIKSEILNKTRGGLDVLLGLYPQAVECVNGTAKKFKMRVDERTPSATIRERGGVWYVCDFGDDGREMNCFDAYMKVNNLRFFAETLHQLAAAYNIDMTLKPDVNKALRIEFEDVEGNPEYKEGDFDYKIKEHPTDEELKVWGSMVKEETLARYHYYSLEWYSAVSRNRETKHLTKRTVYSSVDYPIFLHDCGAHKKVYCMLAYDKAHRFLHLGTKPKDYINGLAEAKAAYERAKEQATTDKTPVEKLPAICICSGERDAMNVAGMGYYPIWLNSESAELSESTVRGLHEISKRVFNIPDLDETGVRQGTRLALQHLNVYTIELPKWLMNYRDNRGKPCKDLCDFMRLRPAKSEFDKLMDTALQAQFWNCQYITNRDGNITENIQIKTVNLLYFLRLNGFYKLKDPITQETRPCRIHDYKVELMEPKQVRDFIREDLRRRQVRNAIMEAYINSKKTTQSMYDDLETVEVNFTISTADSRTLFFDNGSLLITKDDAVLTRAQDCKEFCYQEKVIPHAFKPMERAFHIEDECLYIDNIRSKVFRYLINGSRVYWREELEKRATGDATVDAQYANNYRWSIYGERLTPDEQSEQALYLLNKIYTYGFLLHHFKKDDMAKCVWIMESKLTSEDESSGGSGKSLYMRILHYMHLAQIVTLDGRDGDMTKNNHFLDRVSTRTDLLFIDDAAKNFPFDTFYGKITGQLTVNPKGTQSFEIDYRESPQTVISSNFPWRGDDNSTLRRLLPVVFSDYYHEGSNGSYNETRKVSSDFDGQNLFGHDYTEEDYNADYNFIVNCIQFYLEYQDRVVLPPMDKVRQRVRYNMMGDNFVAWADTYFAENDGEPNPKLDHLLIKQQVYDDFCNDNGRDLKKSAQSFKNKLKIWCQDKGYEFCPPCIKGYKAETQRITQNVYYGITRKSVELLYIRTSPDKPINETPPSL